MPLSRQLGLSLLAVLLLVFVGTLWINVNNTRYFVQQQLASHAQDTATSLGLAISPYMAEPDDMSVVDTMMNAIFDRGYYQSMILRDAKQRILLEKHNPNMIEDVPKWFSSLLPLNPPGNSTAVNDGWTMAGTLTVKSHPGFGYQQLWQNAVQAFWMISGIFTLALVLIYSLVKVVTHPILAVVKQAEAISRQQFEQIEKLPRTPELRSFVEAINRMSARLAKIFKQLTDQAQRYRNFAYQDNLTGVANRRAFELALDQLLADSEQQSQGYLHIVRLTSLQEVNLEVGYTQGDDYIIAVSELIQYQVKKHELNATLFRLSGADFALLLEDAEQQHSNKLSQSLIDAFNAIEKSEYALGTAHMGAGEFTFGDSRVAVLERADNALLKASVSSQKWHLVKHVDSHNSQSGWRDQLQSIFAHPRADFAAQPIKSLSGDVLYAEWFARFPSPHAEGPQYLPMGQLVPASVRLNYAQKLDELLFTSAMQKISHTTGAIGLNLSRLSLCQPTFRQWLLDTLPQSEALCSRLVLEIPERALVNESSEFADFVASIKARGIRITVEHFGAQLAAFAHLRKIRPDYLKIDGRYIRNIDQEPDNQLFVQSLVNIAHGLAIEVIAEMVETEAEAACLKTLFVDHLQGYYVARPGDI